MAVADTDVVVVGAGVGGLALGVALAQAGLPSLLLEAGDGVKSQPRGELLQPNGLRVLADLGLLERLLALDVQVIHTIRVHRRGGELLAWRPTGRTRTCAGSSGSGPASGPTATPTP